MADSKKGRKGYTTLGPTKQVTYRIPLKIYERIEKISVSMFQPVPVILRAAAAEYVKNHRPIRWPKTGIEFKFPDDLDAPVQALNDLNQEESTAGIEPTSVTESAGTESDIPVNAESKGDASE
jgi:hypothetical protein